MSLLLYLSPVMPFIIGMSMAIIMTIMIMGIMDDIMSVMVLSVAG